MVWMHGSFNFYLITFYLKSFPGNMFVNAICFACADLIAYMCSGIVLKFFKIRQGLTFSYLVSLIAGGIYLFSYKTTNKWLIPLLVGISRAGGAMSFNIGYVSVSRLFPTQLVATVFGIVNTVSHLITIGAPLVAEAPEPWPMAVFSVNAISAIFFAMQLKEYENLSSKREKLIDNFKEGEK